MSKFDHGEFLAQKPNLKDSFDLQIPGMVIQKTIPLANEKNLAKQLQERVRLSRKPAKLPQKAFVEIDLDEFIHYLNQIDSNFQPIAADDLLQIIKTQLINISTSFQETEIIILKDAFYNYNLELREFFENFINNIIQLLRNLESRNNISIYLNSHSNIDYILNNLNITGLDLSEGLIPFETGSHRNIIKNEFLSELEKKVLDYLKRNQKLKYLILSKNFGQRAFIEILKSIETNKNLTTLDIKEYSLVNSHLTALTNVLKRNETLTTLTIYRGGRIKAAAITELANALKLNKTLTTLNIYEDCDKYSLSEMSKALYISNFIRTKLNIKDKLQINGVQLPVLSDIEKKQAEAEADKIIELSQEKEEEPTTQAPYSDSAAISDNGSKLERSQMEYLLHQDAKSLTDFLQSDNKIEHIECNDFGVDDETGAKIISSLRNINSLKTLNYSGNKPGLKSEEAISDLLSNNKSLKHVNLQNNNFDIRFTSTLCKIFENNFTLEQLDLKNNLFNDDDFPMIDLQPTGLAVSFYTGNLVRDALNKPRLNIDIELPALSEQQKIEAKNRSERIVAEKTADAASASGDSAAKRDRRETITGSASSASASPVNGVTPKVIKK